LAITSNEKEFADLIREHELLIHKVCRIYGSTVEDREDLFQEIVIQLWNSRLRFRGESKVSTWMYRVAINTAISGLRRKKNFITSPGDLPVHIDSPPPGPEEEQIRDLYQAIERLNDIEKAIVMLYLEDRSYQEMEDILGVSQGTLRVRMNRIKEKLRQLTKNNGYGT
jgi:RNA polymerase sigma factor (sigma-70 family)